MDYLAFESFIHPDVLKAFLIRKEDIAFNVTSDSIVGNETLTVDNIINLSAGDVFIYDNIEYTIRAVDEPRSQIIINALQADLVSGTALTVRGRDYRSSLKNFYEIGNKDYSTFATSLANSNVEIRFDSDVYILKRAFIAMYTWILQNKAFLRDLNLTGVGIEKSQIYEHFKSLLEAEQEELADIRKEAMDEVARRQEAEFNGKSGKGFVRYTAPNRSYFGGYRRW